ncbi:Dabb family protein [Novosphingobium sp.]|uniref:Dabb family protein n=1 Tax=Novosphingobium sp. TaxID=1874826 RepID=UPI003BABE05A
MFVHIFAFKWNDGATAAHIAAAKAAVVAFKDTCPGLVDVFIGENVSANSPGYTTSAAMLFTDRAAYDAYVVHPDHQALLGWLVPLIDPLEIDFEA